MKKRFIALLLCCVMLFTLSPSLISAASATDINGTTVETPTDEPTAEPTVEEPKTEEPKTEEPKTEEPKTEEPKTEEPKTEEPKAEEPKAEEPKAEEPKAEEPKAEEPKTEEPKAEEPKAEDETTIPAAEQPGAPVESEIITPTVNFTNVAPFLAPVTGVPQRRAMAKTFSATPRANDTATDNGIVLNKTATANTDGSYTITLEAYTTGLVKTGEAKPCDIVLVLDKSTSMEETFSGSSTTYEPVYELNKTQEYYISNPYPWEGYSEVTWCSTCTAWTSGCWDFWGHHEGTKYTPKTSESSSGVQFYVQHSTWSLTRLEALQAAASKFIKSVADKSTDDRIAVVWFGQQSTVSSALVDATSNEASLLNAVKNNPNLESATEHGRGMEAAKEILDDVTDTNRNKVVVMITDGEPAPYNTNNWSSRVVKQAVNESLALKNSGVTVYTVSVMPGTNAANPTSPMDKYMTYISSNYPKAEYTGEVIDNRNKSGDSYYSGEENKIIDQITPGEKLETTNGGYYLTAGDLSALDDIFSQIASQTGGATTQLGTTTEIRDIIAPQFAVPAKGTITVAAYDCLTYNSETGKATWKTTPTATNAAVTVDQETRMISVTGFDFDRNFVAEIGRIEGDVSQPGDFHGRKIVITFNTKVCEGFLGGNNVPTNGVTSGIYKDSSASEALDRFPMPTVNVPIKDVTVTATDKNVYLLHTMTDEECKTGAEATCNGVNLLNAAEYTGVNAWKAEFVTITTNITKPTEAMTADGTYTVSVTVAPKTPVPTSTEGTIAVEKSGEKKANINVFKPELTFHDSEVYYGDDVPSDFSGNKTSEVWKHNTTISTDAGVVMTGEKPTLTLTYTPEEDKIAGGKINTKQDIAVNVAVKIDGTNVTTDTTFQHTNCAGKTCTLPEGKEFLLHVKTCQLTITKTGGTNGEPYVFNIYKVGSTNVYTQVTIVPDGDNRSVTIYELPVGTYTIEEDTGWSWRFKPSYSTDVTLSKDNTRGTITCTNSSNGKIYWLNGFSKVLQNIYGESSEKVLGN